MTLHITPAIREEVRRLLRTATVRPTSPDYAPDAALLNRLMPAFVDSIPDATIDTCLYRLIYGDVPR